MLPLFPRSGCRWRSSRSAGYEQPFEFMDDPLALVPAVRAVLQSMDRELPMAEVRSMDDIAAAALAERQFALKVCEAFGLLAIALAGIGVYAMLSYSVEQRKREIGIRIALGASHASVLSMVFANGLQMAAIGAAIGLLLEPRGQRIVEPALRCVGARSPAVALRAGSHSDGGGGGMSGAGMGGGSQ